MKKLILIIVSILTITNVFAQSGAIAIVNSAKQAVNETIDSTKKAVSDGTKFVDTTIKDKFDGYILNQSDEYGCKRPVMLGCYLPKKIQSNANDVVIFFKTKPTKELIELMKERINTFNQIMSEKVTWFTKPIEVYKIMLIEYPVIVTENIICEVL